MSGSLQGMPAEPSGKIRAVFFDLGNVLVLYDVNIAAKKFADVWGVAEKDVWKELYFSDLERAYSKGQISSKEFYERLSEQFPKPVDYETFVHIWNHIFWGNKGIEPLVEFLAKRYSIYLISNTNELHFEFIKEHYPVLRHFRAFFPSHEVGSRKPERAIFEHALKQVNIQPKEAVFIDDVPEFVEGARSVGMHAIQYVSTEQLERDLRALGIKWT